MISLAWHSSTKRLERILYVPSSESYIQMFISIIYNKLYYMLILYTIYTRKCAHTHILWDHRHCNLFVCNFCVTCRYFKVMELRMSIRLDIMWWNLKKEIRINEVFNIQYKMKIETRTFELKYCLCLSWMLDKPELKSEPK